MSTTRFGIKSTQSESKGLTMKIPKKIMVLGQNYKVVFCNTEKEFLKHKDADKCDLGLCCKMTKEIWINGFEHYKYPCADIRLAETFLHEVGHAAMEESGLSYGLTETLEEIIVDVYSKVIVKLPKDLV